MKLRSPHMSCAAPVQFSTTRLTRRLAILACLATVSVSSQSISTRAVSARVARPDRPTTPLQQDIIVDDLSENFYRLADIDNPPALFNNSSPDTDKTYLNHAYWASTSHVSDIGFFNLRGEWYPPLTRGGDYEVAVYIPAVITGTSDTACASYEIHHADGVSQEIVNQAANPDGWVVLDTYRFNQTLDQAGTLRPQAANFVRLSYVTCDQQKRSILFDAMRFRPISSEQCTNNSARRSGLLVPFDPVVGEQFRLELQMTNTGSCTWTAEQGYRLRDVSGVIANELEPRSSVPPGSAGQFWADLRAPSQPGHYELRWQIAQNGIPFGEIQSIDITARLPAPSRTPTQFPTKTPDPTATPPPGLCASAGGDADGDGLCSDWERRGIRGVDLPGMGADPNRPDIYVEMDYFEDAAPKSAFVDRVVEAFARHNIALHIDVGSRFGAWARSNKISGNGSITDSDFAPIKRANFNAARAGLFHYAISASHFTRPDGSPAQGIGESPLVSFNLDGRPGDDLIVAVSGAPVITQAGIFMHELGHNLSLNHGGRPGRAPVPYDETKNKPNQLSVMNYALGYRGLIYQGEEGYLDYAAYDMAYPLDEDMLDERVGINGGTRIQSYGTRWFCPLDRSILKFKWPPSGFALNADGPIDWDCFGGATGTARADINGDGNRGWLRAYSEWDKLILTGGDIGHSGTLAAGHHALSIAQEEDPPYEPPLTWGNELSSPYWFTIHLPASTTVVAGGQRTVTLTIANAGTHADAYTATGSVQQGPLEILSPPASISLAPGQSGSVNITLRSTAERNAGTEGVVSVGVRSSGSPRIDDTASLVVSIRRPPTIGPVQLVLPHLMRDTILRPYGVATGAPTLRSPTRQPLTPSPTSTRTPTRQPTARPTPTAPILDQPGPQTLVTIDARQTKWMVTDHMVVAGQHLDVRVVRGTWTHWRGSVPPNAGEGSGGCDADCPVPTMPKGSLVGRIGGVTFLIGHGRSIVPTASGPLELAMNDAPGGEGDNEGVLSVLASHMQPGMASLARVTAAWTFWQPTSLEVSSLQSVTIDVVEGAWTHWRGSVSPNPGIGQGRCSACPLPSAPNGALIGRIGDMIIHIGQSATVTVQEPGQLFVTINDDPGSDGDNDGVLIVKVQEWWLLSSKTTVMRAWTETTQRRTLQLR